MGKLSNAVLDYFDDNVRFANLFNGSLFGGRNVVNPQELAEGSEVYPDEEPRVEELTKEDQNRVMLSASDIANVMIGDKRIVAKMKEYQEEYEEEYDMCDGLKGIIEDSKNEGKDEERKVGIQFLVESCQEIGGSVEAAISQLVSKYKLSLESAGDCVKQYWR